jgi:hypothetical protein
MVENELKSMLILSGVRVEKICQNDVTKLLVLQGLGLKCSFNFSIFNDAILGACKSLFSFGRFVAQ